jgi:hypothetical protein
MFKFLVAIIFVCAILISSLVLAEELDNRGILNDYAKAIEINTGFLNKRVSEEINICAKNKDKVIINKCIEKFRRVNSKLMKMILELPEPVKEIIK